MIGQNVTETVESLITAQAAELTPAERKLTAELMRDYPVSGLRSVTKLADDAGVSTPTVIRLARKLGFEGFPEMQAALRSEASGRLNSGAIDDSGWTVASRVSPTFEAFTSAIYRNLARTIERLDPATFAEIADVLADDANRIWLHGGRLTHAQAQYFATLLHIIRADVSLIPVAPTSWPPVIADMGRETVLVLFDIRRYDPALSRLAASAADQGARIILFTDTWGSPIKSFAEKVVSVAIEAPSSWDSTLGLTLAIEALVAETQDRRKIASQDRIEALEELLRSGRI